MSRDLIRDCFSVVVYAVAVGGAIGGTVRLAVPKVSGWTPDVLGPRIVETVFVLHVVDTVLLIGPLAGVLVGHLLGRRHPGQQWYVVPAAGVTAVIGFIAMFVILGLAIAPVTPRNLFTLSDDLPFLTLLAMPTSVLAIVGAIVGSSIE